MSTVTNSAITKIAAVTAGLAMFASFALVAPAQAASLTNAQVQSILSLLSSFGANTTVIANVKASLTGGTPTSTTSGTTSSSSCTFTMSLTNGNKGSDVTCLQNALIAAGYTIPAGATGYFGNQTKSAVAAWQKANNITPAVGYFGPISRSHWNLGGTTTGTTGTTGGTTTGTTGGTTALTGNGLQVSLAQNSPNGTVLVAGQGIGDLGEFTFTNPTSAAIKVTNLSFNRIGVSNDATMVNVYLYNGTQRITDSAGVTNSKFSYSNSAGLFTVPAGGTYTVAVRSDILTGTSGQQIGVSLTSVGSTGTLDSSVSFPVVGGMQAISSANLAGVYFSTNTLPVTNGNLSPTADYTVWQNTINVSTNPVKLTTMTFTNLGSINANNIQNLRLFVDGTQVGSAVSQLSAARTVTFDLSTNPDILATGNHIIKVVANVTGGSSRTFALSLQRSSDAMFVDTDLGQPVTPTIGNSTTSFSAVTSGVQTVASVSGTSGVSVNKAVSSPINDVAVGATNVKLASFNILASGEAVKVRDLYVYANTALANGKIMVNGVQMGSTKTIGISSNATDFSLGSSLIIPAGTVTVVNVYADAKTPSGTTNVVTNGTSVQVSLQAASSNGQGQSSLNSVDVPATNDVPGNSITVSNSALTATKYSGYGDQTVLAGAQQARLGSFTLSAGSTEGVNVNTIGINIGGTAVATSPVHTPASDVQNLTLKDHATGATIGSVITTPSATGNTFSANFTIPASGTKTIDVYGNVLTTAVNNDTIIATVNTSTTGTGSVTSNSSSVATPGVPLQTMTVGAGALTFALGASNPVNANVIAGASIVPVADYTFAAQSSPYTVKKLEFTVPTTAATSMTGLTLSYKDASGATQTATGAIALGTTNNTVTFTGLSFFVPKDGTADLSVSTGIPTISNGATSGAALSVNLSKNWGFQAVNSAGIVLQAMTGTLAATTVPGTVLASANNGYGTMYVRKSFPTFAMQSVGTTPVAGQALYRVNVTANTSGAVDLNQLSFTVATSTATAAGFTLYDVTGGSATVINTSTVQANSAGIVTIPFTALQQIGAGQTKTYELRAATITGWGTGASITVSLASDSGFVANNNATTLASNNTVWSDLSASGITAAATTDWTNGYLLKDFTSDTTSFNY